MTKGLFTTTEEMYFEMFLKGRIRPVKVSPKERRDIKKENRRIAQNVKRINQGKIQGVWRER